jgi:hypothetical protein
MPILVYDVVLLNMLLDNNLYFSKNINNVYKNDGMLKKENTKQMDWYSNKYKLKLKPMFYLFAKNDSNWMNRQVHQ